MAHIRPFRGLRYAAADLVPLVAPPYDVLSPEERDELASRSAHNVVHLTLPEQKEDDRSKFVKYQRSNAALVNWRNEGALRLEEDPAFYRYTQVFSIPGHPGRISRTSVIALIKTEPYEKGVVLPHEQTFPKHKADRLLILETTRAHLECIYGLFEDPDGSVLGLIQSAPTTSEIAVTTDDGVEHLLEPITDPTACRQIAAAMEDKKVWIADGHHRYETARQHRENQGDADGLISEDFMMMALSSMSDPGLVLLPTHRILSEMSVSPDHLDNLLQSKFNIRKAGNGMLMGEISRLMANDTRAFGIALPGGVGLIATMEEPEAALKWINSDDSHDLKMLDVTILHRVIFEELLGIKGLDTISYTRDPQEAVEAVKNGAAAAFLMNPPTVDDMKRIAIGGEKMPQKSTYYYPKILSGLVIWSLNDF